MAERHEVKGLDTLRFVAAGIVALSHGAAFPLSDAIGRGSGWARALTGLYGVSFDGVAAVIIFFVISGFCIHHGPATGAPYRIGPFWVRRGVRILIPMAAAIGLAKLLGAPAQGALGAVLWSVYCELIYYALYPLLRVGFRRFGLVNLTIGSFVVAGAVIALGWNETYYWSFPIALMWIVGLPAWLLGCVLAERVAAIGEAAGPGNVWAWRLAVWVYATLALVVFFHAPFRIGYPALLFPFQALAYLWIFAEIRHFARDGVSPFVEWCGRWSYSLYLIHNIAISATPLVPSAYVLDWLVRVGAVIGGSLAFYGLVEAPSHWLARTAARRLSSALRGGRPTDAQLASP